MTVDIGSEVAVQDRHLTAWGPERGYRIGVVTSWVRRPYRVTVRIGEKVDSRHVADLVAVTDEIRESIKADNAYVVMQNLACRAHDILSEMLRRPDREYVKHLPALRAFITALEPRGQYSPAE